MLERLRKRLFLAAIAAVSAYLLIVDPWRRRWEGTAEEVARPLPGDDLLPLARISGTFAVTLDAPTVVVWPVLLEPGVRGGGGFYGPSRAQGSPGVDAGSAGWPNVRLGDSVAIDRGEPFRIVAIDAGRSFAAYRDVAGAATSWAFLLEPVESDRSRLIERFRAVEDPRRSAARLGWISGLGALLRVRRQVLGARRRLEGSAGRA